MASGSGCIDFSLDLPYSENAFEINHKASRLIFRDVISSKYIGRLLEHRNQGKGDVIW